MLKFKVKKSEAGKRADIVVSEHLPTYSRSSLKQLFLLGLVTIKNTSVKASRKLAIGESIDVNTALLELQPDDIEIPIIYEDSDVIVMNKPAGVLTHSKGALNTEATVASFIKPMLNEESMTDNRAGIVHRLDRATSGVIIAAKNVESVKWLQKQFSTRKAKKMYLAIVEGVPNPPEAIIDAPIERNPKRPQTFRVGANGRLAQTSYKALKNITRLNKKYSLLELVPRTGRTHQLRVHLKYTGHPIVGDRVYGHGGDVMFLHAKSLEITLPNGQTKQFEAPVPKIFKDFNND